MAFFQLAHAWSAWQDVAVQAVTAEFLQQGAVALVTARSDLSAQQQQNAKLLDKVTKLEQDYQTNVQRLEEQFSIDTQLEIHAALQTCTSELTAAFEAREREAVMRLEQERNSVVQAAKADLQAEYAHSAVLSRTIQDKEKEYAALMETVAERIHNAEVSIEHEKAAVLTRLAERQAVEQQLLRPIPVMDPAHMTFTPTGEKKKRGYF
jgi:hypothetical protein